MGLYIYVCCVIIVKKNEVYENIYILKQSVHTQVYSTVYISIL